MKKKLIFVAFSICCTYSISLEAQSIYYPHGKSGPHLDIQYASIDKNNIWGVVFGFVGNGRLDLGLAVTRKFSNSFRSRNFTIVGPYMEYLLLKQHEDESTPLSISLGGSYGLGNGSSSSSFNTQNISVGFYRSGNIPETGKIIPEVSPFWARNSNGGSTSESTFGISLGLSFLASSFYFRPVYTIGFNDDYQNNFSLGAGYIFGLNKKIE